MTLARTHACWLSIEVIYLLLILDIAQKDWHHDVDITIKQTSLAKHDIYVYMHFH